MTLAEIRLINTEEGVREAVAYLVSVQEFLTFGEERGFVSVIREAAQKIGITNKQLMEMSRENVTTGQ